MTASSGVRGSARKLSAISTISNDDGDERGSTTIDSPPPGMISGLIFGGVLRIERLCSKKEDVDAKLVQLYHRLLRHGYTPSCLIPLFVKARANARLYLARSERGHDL